MPARLAAKPRPAQRCPRRAAQTAANRRPAAAASPGPASGADNTPGASDNPLGSWQPAPTPSPPPATPPTTTSAFAINTSAYAASTSIPGQTASTAPANPTADLSQIASQALDAQIPTLQRSSGSGDGEDFASDQQQQLLFVAPDQDEASAESPEAVAEAPPQQGRLREVLALAVPALGSIVADPLMSLVDTGCVGQVSSVHLASLGPNTAIFNFVFQVFAFIGVATTNVVATNSPTAPDLSDEERHDRRRFCERFVCYALQCAVYAGVAVCLSLQLWGPWLLSSLGADGPMAEPALAYLRIRALASPAVMAMCVFQGASLGLQDSLTPLRIFAIAGVANLIGDWVLTLGLGMGASGAAWATLAAQVAGVMIFFATLRRKNRPRDGIRLVWRGFPQLSVLRPFLSVASTLVSRTIFTMVAFTLTSYAATTLGLTVTAAHQVALQVFWFLSFFPEPLSVAAQSLIARDMGAEDGTVAGAEASRPLAQLLMKLGVVFGTLLSFATAGVLILLPGLFTTDPNVVALLAQAAPLASASVFVVALVMVCDGISIGSGDFQHLPRTNLVATAAAAATVFGTGPGSSLCRVWLSLLVFFGVRLVQHVLHAATHRKGVLAQSLYLARH